MTKIKQIGYQQTDLQPEQEAQQIFDELKRTYNQPTLEYLALLLVRGDAGYIGDYAGLATQHILRRQGALDRSRTSLFAKPPTKGGR